MLHSEVMHFAGDRAAVRQATLHHSLRRLLELLALSQGDAASA
jgi:nicotinamide mononucleotide (NMN) deamidase PncC